MEPLLLVACLAGVVLLVVLALTLPARLAAATRAAVADRLDALSAGQDRLERALRDELKAARAEAAQAAAQARQELRASLRDGLGSIVAQLAQHTDGTWAQLQRLTESNEKRLEAVRATVEDRLARLQEDNGQKLELMRQTVDEKLHGTLEKRLGESFKLVGDRLEAVQAGLGEMRALATDVGDLKKVMSNVKIRGTWGEVQLGHLLEQVLAPEQYVANAVTRKGSLEKVEYAIRLPGRDGDGQEVLLPIDAKFPVEDYQRLVDASERSDAAGVEAASRALEGRIRGCAATIQEKYLNPPVTTDFAILFLPTEGLYAEVIRRPGLAEALQRDHRVTVAGPTTLSALLNSLQMGFRTLTIQKRSSEVWQVLSAVKTEFGKFGGILDKVDKKLQEAHHHIQEVGRRRRALEGKLKDVQELPSSAAASLLPAPEPEPEAAEPAGPEEPG